MGVRPGLARGPDVVANGVDGWSGDAMVVAQPFEPANAVVQDPDVAVELVSTADYLHRLYNTQIKWKYIRLVARRAGVF